MTPTIAIPTLLDVALSLTFVFFIVSMFVSGIWEFIGTVIRDKRATLLRTSLEQMINSKDFANLLYNHPLIKGHIIVRPQQVLEKVFGKVLTRVKVGEQYLIKDSTAPAGKPQVKSLEESLPVVPRDASKSPEDDDSPRTDIVTYPSYIAPSVFSRVLMGFLEQYVPVSDPPPPSPFAQVQERISQFTDSVNTMPIDDSSKQALKEILSALSQDATDVKGLVVNIESWYMEYMNRLTGYYKMYSQQGVRIVAIVVVLLFNLDAFNLTVRLYNDKPLREATVAEAISFTKAVNDTVSKKQNSQAMAIYDLGITSQFTIASAALRKKGHLSKADSATLAMLVHHRDSLMASKRKLAILVQPSDSLSAQLNLIKAEKDYLDQLPFGWKRLCTDYKASKHPCPYVFTVILGWILMVAAVSFGAPFWFDLLLKLVNIRNAGKNPADKS